MLCRKPKDNTLITALLNQILIEEYVLAAPSFPGTLT